MISFVEIFFVDNTQPIIQVTDLFKNYAEIKAVNGITFSVFAGEIFGLLGPNGAGKTTTLEIIETLRKKTSGDVVVAGYSIDKNPEEIKQRIGVQLQAANYYPNLSLNQLLDLFDQTTKYPNAYGQEQAKD